MARQTDEWWVRISHAFSAHVRDEAFVLDAYAALAASTSDAGTRFLLELILADEQRHHEVFERLVAASEVGAGPGGIPHAPEPPAHEIPELLAQTRRFLEFEREDATSLKALGRELRPAHGETLWRLLVELMELDTEKHLRILGYLEHRLEELGG